MCSIKALIANGLLRMAELEDTPEDTLSYEYVPSIAIQCLTDYRGYNRERREHSAFQKLLRTVPSLEERLMEGSDENMIHIADLVCFYCTYGYQYQCSHVCFRFRKVFQALDRMTLRA
jgi:hypothetical protein